jgi:hypothetical protein
VRTLVFVERAILDAKSETPVFVPLVDDDST